MRADRSAVLDGTTVPGAPNCPLFPANNVWNTNISRLPVNRACPWGSKHTAVTPSAWTFGTFIMLCPVRASVTRTARSWPTLANTRPRGENASPRTLSP